MSLAAPEGRRKEEKGVSNGGGRKKGLTRSMEEERAIYCAAERRKNWTETEDSLWY